MLTPVAAAQSLYDEHSRAIDRCVCNSTATGFIFLLRSGQQTSAPLRVMLESANNLASGIEIGITYRFFSEKCVRHRAANTTRRST
jgi:hypothetical protein